MRFGLPGEETTVTSDFKEQPLPLRAEGAMSYLQFIGLVQRLWEEVHPDIPIRPTQSQQYAGDNRPVIIYSLENRKTHAPEPKQRYREQVAGLDKNVIVNGQRFQNYIAFSVVDEDPYAADQIIEAFEEFMLEYTPAFKRLGLSDIFYSRRLSDREETRDADDKVVRTVVYMVIIERVTALPVSKLEKIITNVSVQMRPMGNYAWVPAPNTDVGYSENVLNVSDVTLKPGDAIRILLPLENDLKYFFTHNSDTMYIPGTQIEVETQSDPLPVGVHGGQDYSVEYVHDNSFTLSGVSFTTGGWFRFAVVNDERVEFIVDIDDRIDPATPNS